MINKNKKETNYYIQFCKLIASMFVVFIHIKFPNNLGRIMDCLSRFAVPLFFAISGYFSYQIKSKTISKRIIKLFKLNIIATSIYALWGCFVAQTIIKQNLYIYLLEKLSIKNIAKWIFLNNDPFSEHLWYLSAIIVCYLILWIYTRLFEKKQINYRPLYMISICLILFQIIISLNFVAINKSFYYLVYRNALFTGLPMFSLGIFINEYKDKIIRSFNLNRKKLIIIIIIGILLSLLQWYGIGKSELPFGAILEVIGLMLLLVTSPPISINSKYNISSIIGNISLIIYIIHPLINKIIEQYSEKIYIFSLFRESIYLYPLTILDLALVCGIIYSILFYKKKS